MANKKRSRNGYKQKLGGFNLNRRDILALEKILRVYADAKEMHSANVTSPPLGKRHMPRKYVDRHVAIGRYRPFYITIGWHEYGIHYPGVSYFHYADSVKFLSKRIKRTRYLQIAAKPGIEVTFRPFSTTIYAQIHYATGKELKVMNEAVALIEDYLIKSKPAYINKIILRS